MSKPVRVRMDPKWKKRWVKALRSGKYKQAQGQLKSDNGFCCLGVLCDVVSTYKTGGGNWIPRNEYLEFQFKDDSEAGVLPSTVVELVKLYKSDPEVASGGRKLSLAEWNDTSKLSFERIANIIEREL